MKLVTAIIKPFKLDEVRKALAEIDVDGMTITDVRGFGKDAGVTETYRGVEHHISYMPKVQIDTVVPEKLVKQTVDAIEKAAHTGRVGDGKIFVYNVENARCISTGNKDNSAL